MDLKTERKYGIVDGRWRGKREEWRGVGGGYKGQDALQELEMNIQEHNNEEPRVDEYQHRCLVPRRFSLA